MVDKKRMQCMEVWGGNQATDTTFETPGLELCVFSRPYRGSATGGDVYYVSSCASGRVTRMLLSDVSGHGKEASSTAIKLRNLMRENVNYIDQSSLIEKINRQFSEVSEVGWFATAVVATFFSPTKTLTISNAGHPIPVIYRAATRHWETFEAKTRPHRQARNLPLGFVDDTGFDQLTTKLHDGDILLLYTDAFTESRDESDRMIRTQGLVSHLEQLDPDQPAKLVPGLLEAIASKSVGNLQSDDTTAILVHATGSTVPFSNNLLAPFRFSRALLKSTSLPILARLKRIVLWH